MARVLSKDLGKLGISVNVVAPGPTRTGLFSEGKSEQLIQFFQKLEPIWQTWRAGGLLMLWHSCLRRIHVGSQDKLVPAVEWRRVQSECLGSLL
jgi:NAD(P)-dependent dehydrogenase (short-subunit alcohol dehydrogenase family)